MRGVIADLEDRNNSILCLLEHVQNLSENKGKVDIIVILKSSVFIAIYNNTEATLYACFEKIHSVLSQKKYIELPNNLKTIMLKYSFGKKSSLSMSDRALVDKEEKKLILTEAKFPELSDYIRRQSLFSGNIDVRKINDLCKSYGILKQTPSIRDSHNMLWVKNKRNKIAHGEQSMLDGGKGIKNNELKNAYNSTDIILRTFISSCDDFIAKQI
ncbi:MAE_28990/MAE_18760 family HEPN-like nuclease [Aeromonas jandaei]|uniref:MAE_28990/MAE_18760 family HEPN-like nuclease n=1 Tax=Aeromonas jandaei TaxID=650 RepID=UPI003D21CF02